MKLAPGGFFASSPSSGSNSTTSAAVTNPPEPKVAKLKAIVETPKKKPKPNEDVTASNATVHTQQDAKKPETKVEATRTNLKPKEDATATNAAVHPKQEPTVAKKPETVLATADKNPKPDEEVTTINATVHQEQEPEVAREPDEDLTPKEKVTIVIQKVNTLLTPVMKQASSGIYTGLHTVAHAAGKNTAEYNCVTLIALYFNLQSFKTITTFGAACPARQTLLALGAALGFGAANKHFKPKQVTAKEITPPVLIKETKDTALPLSVKETSGALDLVLEQRQSVHTVGNYLMALVAVVVYLKIFKIILTSSGAAWPTFQVGVWAVAAAFAIGAIEKK